MASLCFLFNHDQPHQIAHSLPIARQMAQMDVGKITLAVTNHNVEQVVRGLLGSDLDRFELVRLDLRRRVSRFLAGSLNGVIPASKILIYRDNIDFFRQFDALVVSEKTSLLLKQRYGLDNLRIIHTRHGAGDRAIGFGKQSSQFDLVLVSGPKIARRLQSQAGVSPERISVVGYSKFDLHGETRFDPGFADPLRPTVVYNPHPSPRLSSWYRMGRDVLEQFYHSDRFNFIFAPHMMLFERDWTVTISPPAVRRMQRPDRKYGDAPHMLIDLGSTASTDMSYTNVADIYIGDVSSQIYEFLHRPRPCLFLDAHNVRWNDNADYLHWQSGPVCRPGDDLVEQAEAALASHGDFLPVQQRLLQDSFCVTDTPASQRAAVAIREFLAR